MAKASQRQVTSSVRITDYQGNEILQVEMSGQQSCSMKQKYNGESIKGQAEYNTNFEQIQAVMRRQPKCECNVDRPRWYYVGEIDSRSKRVEDFRR